MAIERFMPALERLGIGGQLVVPEDRSKKKINYVSLPSGFVILAGANTNNLQSKTARRVNCDEVYLWKQGFLKEAKKRCTKYWNKKIFKVSTAGDKGQDLDVEFESGTKEEWHLGCPNCQKLSFPKLERLKWDNEGCKNQDGSYDLSRLMESVRYECEHCLTRFVHTSEFAKKANDIGGYVRTNFQSAPRCRSFRWNALCLPPHEVSHGQLVVEFVLATQDSRNGNDLPLKEFLQKRMAESWNPHQFSESKFLPTTPEGEWPDEKHRFGTVDVQRDHFWVLIRAWSSDGRSRALWFGRSETWAEVQEKLDEYKVDPGFVLVDSGFNTEEVYSECALRNSVKTFNGGASRDWWGWLATKGEGLANKSYKHSIGKGRVVLQPYGKPQYVKSKIGDSSQRNLYCKLVLWSNNAVKDITVKLRDGKGAEWLGLDDKDWQEGQFSERKVRVRKGMTTREVWQQIGKRPNHAWDCEQLQTLQALRVGILGSGVVETEDKEEVQEEETTA
jgi:hypothetical protein